MNLFCSCMFVHALLATTVAVASSKIDHSKFVETSSVAAATVQRALALSEWTQKVRRELHQCPELLYDLDETSGYVARTLDELHIPYTAAVAQTGIVATIGSGAASMAAASAVHPRAVHSFTSASASSSGQSTCSATTTTRARSSACCSGRPWTASAPPAPSLR